MRASRITTRLLVGGGAAAFVLLAGASAAGAANPPGLRPVISASPTSPGTDPSPTWSFSDPKGDPTTCSLALGATTVFGPTSCTGSVTYDLTGHNYGTYTFTVDNGKASATDTYSFVPAAPTITTSAPSPDNDTTPTWSFTLPSGTTGRCTLTSGGATVAGPATCSGS
ncbi:MAG: hypothetical protein QOI20_962, partial [Acidimicrobiaceae bacterium]|nr:hypothetical protein [Acidimicrobiaceae bacterium]